MVALTEPWIFSSMEPLEATTLSSPCQTSCLPVERHQTDITNVPPNVGRCLLPSGGGRSIPFGEQQMIICRPHLPKWLPGRL